MISLSNLIKPIWPNLEQGEEKVISIKKIGSNEQEEDEQSNEQMMERNADLLSQAQAEAEQILQKARREYEAAMADIQVQRHSWQEEKEWLIQQAKEEGYQDGWKEGQQHGYAEYRTLIEEAKGIIHAAKGDYATYLESSEKVILELAVKIAEKIVAKKIEEEEYFTALVKRALKEVKECHDIRIHVHPHDYTFVLSQKEELLSIFSNEAKLFIYPDEEMTQGGCIIESETGRIDASIDTQLSEVKKILTEILESEAS